MHKIFIFWFAQRVFKLLISQLSRFLGKPEGPSFNRIKFILEALVESNAHCLLIQYAYEDDDDSVLNELCQVLFTGVW